MKSTLLLDTTFVSDLDAELTRRETGPARAFFERMRQAVVFVSVVTLEEFYEKRGHEAARELAARFSILGIHAGDALRSGLLVSGLSRQQHSGKTTLRHRLASRIPTQVLLGLIVDERGRSSRG